MKASGGIDLVDEDREAVVKSHYEDVFRQNGVAGDAGRALAESVIELSLERERELDS